MLSSAPNKGLRAYAAAVAIANHEMNFLRFTEFVFLSQANILLLV